jgi:archaemetzincin
MYKYFNMFVLIQPLEKRKISIFFKIVAFALIIASCNEAPQHSSDRIKKSKQDISKRAERIIIQPLGLVDKTICKEVYNELSKIFPSVKLNKSKPMPQHAYYPSRRRYRADSIIAWLKMDTKADEKCIAITMVDISTSKGAYKDWGIMGLGYQPGPTSVASSYRLKDKNEFWKVVVHELGHNFGLSHCTDKTCFMRDAEGGNPTNQEDHFCKKCRLVLLKAGWLLSN